MVNIAEVTDHDLPELADLYQQLSPMKREEAQRFYSSADYTSHGRCAFKQTL